MTGTAPPSALPDGLTPIDQTDRPYQRASVRGPAFIVLGIAVFILIGGVVASVLDTGPAPVLTLKSITIPGGLVVRLTPATTALKPIISDGQPPADILAALAVPAGSVRTGTVNSDQNLTQYSRTASFTLPASVLSSTQLVAFYRKLLPRLGWQVIYDGPGTGSDHGVDTGDSSDTEVLGKLGSGDGFYWEMGAVVPPATSVGTTPYSVVLFEIPDAD